MNNTSPFEEFVPKQENKLSFGIGKALLYSAIAVIIMQFAGGIISVPALFYKPLNHLLLPLGFLTGTVCAIVILLMLTQTKFASILKDIKHSFTPIQLILSIACWLFLLPLAEVATSLIPTTGPLEEIYKIFQASFEMMLDYKIAGFIMICILAPIFEEIIFRGIILKGMLNFNVNPTTAILINGFIFGCAHMNPWQFIGAGLLGIIFGIVITFLKQYTFLLVNVNARRYGRRSFCAKRLFINWRNDTYRNFICLFINQKNRTKNNINGINFCHT